VNWKGILILGVIAGLTNLLYIYDVLSARGGYIVFLLVLIAVAVWSAKGVSERPFLHGFWIGVVYTVVAKGLVTITLMDAAVTNVPELEDPFSRQVAAEFTTWSLSIFWLYLALSTIIQSIIYGLIIGAVSWFGWTVSSGMRSKRPDHEDLPLSETQYPDDNIGI